MREIKFRAWDKEKKRMCRVLSVGTNDDGSAALLTLWASFGQVDAVGDGYPKRFELMQYTGLKDKNDKEIYEGDIVNRHLDYPPRVITWMPDGRYTGWFSSRSENQQTTNIMDHLPLGEDAEEIEVIGNIYENPELLKT